MMRKGLRLFDVWRAGGTGSPAGADQNQRRDEAIMTYDLKKKVDLMNLNCNAHLRSVTRTGEKGLMMI